MDLSNQSSKKPQALPLGVDDYRVMIEEDYIHIDKTLLIKEFWEQGASVTLVTRPRRFGKSITLSMLRCFFEKIEPSMKAQNVEFQISNLARIDPFNAVGIPQITKMTSSQICAND